MITTRATIVLACCAALAACAESNPSDVTGLTPGAPSLARATGDRASGHADITNFTNVTQTYSFVALATGTAPAATGQMEGQVVTPGSTIDIHVEVDCLVVIGNRARVSGLTKKFTLNGEDRPPIHVLFEVQDNGEGANSPPDLASALSSTQPQGCRLPAAFPLVPSERGNIQVEQR